MKEILMLLYFSLAIITNSVNGQANECLEITCLNPTDFVEESKKDFTQYYLVKSISDTVIIEYIRNSGGPQHASIKNKVLLPGQSDTIKVDCHLTSRGAGIWNKATTIFTNKCTQTFYTKFIILPPVGPIPYAIFEPSHPIYMDTLYPNMNWYGIRVKDYPDYEQYSDKDGYKIPCEKSVTEPHIEDNSNYEIKKISPVITKSGYHEYSVDFPYKNLFKCVIGIAKPILTEDSVYHLEEGLAESSDSILNFNYYLRIYRMDTSIALTSTSSNECCKLFYEKVGNFNDFRIKEVIADDYYIDFSSGQIKPTIFFAGELDSDDLPDFIIKYSQYNHLKSYQLILSTKLKLLKNSKSFIRY